MWKIYRALRHWLFLMWEIKIVLKVLFVVGVIVLIYILLNGGISLPGIKIPDLSGSTTSLTEQQAQGYVKDVSVHQTAKGNVYVTHFSKSGIKYLKIDKHLATSTSKGWKVTLNNDCPQVMTFGFKKGKDYTVSLNAKQCLQDSF